MVSFWCRRPIDARIVVVVVVGQRRVAGIVVEFRDDAAIGDVRLREERDELGDGGVDSVGRDLVVGKGRPVAGVVDGGIFDANACAGCGTEVADALIVERHGGDAAYTLLDARALVIEEVEELVFGDRPADAAAELILIVSPA